MLFFLHVKWFVRITKGEKYTNIHTRDSLKLESVSNSNIYRFQQRKNNSIASYNRHHLVITFSVVVVRTNRVLFQWRPSNPFYIFLSRSVLLSSSFGFWNISKRCLPINISLQRNGTRCAVFVAIASRLLHQSVRWKRRNQLYQFHSNELLFGGDLQ